MLYLVHRKRPTMEVRFQLAMLVSVWMKFYLCVSHYSLTSLEVKGRRHWEKSRVASFFGKKNTSSFQARHQGHLLHRETIHHLQGNRLLPVHRLLQVHLQVHRLLPVIVQSMTPTRVHLNLRSRLHPLRAKSGRISPLRRAITDAQSDSCRPSQEYRRFLPRGLTT